MVDDSGRSGPLQLLMMLVQQAGSGSLPLSILAPDGFLPFIRQVEQLLLSEKLNPVIVYWRRHGAGDLLPSGKDFGLLLRESTYVACFSDERAEGPDEWSVIVETPRLSMVIYGQQAIESAENHKYQCAGSMDPSIVRESFNRLLPVWQSLSLADSNRIEDARISLGPGGSDPRFVQQLKGLWPILKGPIQQSLIIDGNSFEQENSGETVYQLTVPGSSQAAQTITGPNKIQPIAMDYMAGNAPVAGMGGSIASDSGAHGVPLANFSPPAQAAAFVDAQNKAVSRPNVNLNVNSPRRSQHSIKSMPEGSVYGDIVEPDALAGAESSLLPAKARKNQGNRTNSGMMAMVPAGSELNPAAMPGGKNIIPPSAQSIISEIIGQLRHSSDLNSILQYAIETLTTILGADRGLMWKVVGDQLAVTSEYSIGGNTCFVDNQLNSQESMSIVLEFLSRFPDESGAGVISIPDTAQDTDLHKMSRTLSSLLELGDVRGRLMVQLRSRGIFSGFLELQQCGRPREWSTEDAVVLQKVAEMLSVVVQQSFDQSKIEMDAQEMKLINEIASLFRDSKGESSRDSLVKSVMLVADHMGFIHSQIYLFNQDLNILEPQIRENQEGSMDLSNKDNPFVAVFESGRGKVVNMEYSRKGDPFFGHDMALVLPLVSEGHRMGVIGLWQRQPKRPQFRPQDRELGLTIAGHLSNVIRADMAVQQIRADQLRESLINKVSLEIRRSLKEADQIMDTLVKAVQEYFDLDLCVVSLFDSMEGQMPVKSVKCKFAGQEEEFPQPLPPAMPGMPMMEENPEIPEAQQIADLIARSSMQFLLEGQTVHLSPDEMKERLPSQFWSQKWEERAVTLVPLGQGNNFKAILLLVARDSGKPMPDKDMRMVIDLADRVGVVISHAELFATVERQAVTDAMTGLFNRRYFEEQLSKEIDRFQRFGHPFSFIIVDLDFLKKINDNLGHHVGDAAIIHIGNVIKRSVREIDTVGRFGGEEFVILLPETDLKWAKMVAERICAAIREKPVEGAGIVTGSVGVATFPNDAQDKTRLFELADQALFLAKHRGRNQVCTVTEDLLPSLADGGEERLKNAMKQDIRMGPPVANLDSTGDSASVEGNKNETADTAGSAKSGEIQLAGHFDVEFIKEKGLLGLIAQLIRQVEDHSAYTAERSSRAYAYANRIAQSLHLAKDHTEVVSLAAVMCNLGKMVVPEEILKKPDPLSDEDRIYINQVPHAVAKFLEPAKMLSKISPIVEAYQEHWDGSGYPNGIKGDVIPIEARIVSLVDAYTAMTSQRPYREAMTKAEAIKAIQDGSGKEWDPRIVKIFLSLLNKEVEPEKPQ